MSAVIDQQVNHRVIINTPRLSLRPIRTGDGIIIHPAKRESWLELLRWSIWTQKPLDELTVADDEEFCRRKHEQFSSGSGLTFLAFHHNKEMNAQNFVGAGSLNDCDWLQRNFTLGFWVRTPLANHGYATEIGTALGRYAFAELHAKKLKTYHAEGNESSRKVIQKLGFAFSGIRTKAEQLCDGEYVNHFIYDMINPQSLPSLKMQWSFAHD